MPVQRLRELFENLNWDQISTFLQTIELPQSIEGWLHALSNSDIGPLQPILLAGAGILILFMGRNIMRLLIVSAGFALGTLVSLYVISSAQEHASALHVIFTLLAGFAGAVLTKFIYRAFVIVSSFLVGIALTLVVTASADPIVSLIVGMGLALVTSIVPRFIEVVLMVTIGIVLIALSMGIELGLEQVPILAMLALIGVAWHYRSLGGRILPRSMEKAARG